MRKLAIPLVLLGGVTAVSGLLSQRLPTGFIPDEDQGYAIVGVQLPDGASLQRTGAVYTKINQILAKQPGISTYNGVAGFSIFTRTAAPYTGLAFIGLAPWDERKSPALTATSIIASLNKQFAAIPEARIFAVAPPAIPGISAAGGFSMMLQDKSGGSCGFLAQNVMKFVAEASKRPELQGVRPNFSPAVPQLFADVDKNKAIKQGVQVSEIYNALQTFLGDSYVNDFFRTSVGSGEYFCRSSQMAVPHCGRLRARGQQLVRCSAPLSFQECLPPRCSASSSSRRSSCSSSA